MKYRAGYKYQVAETHQAYTLIEPSISIHTHFIDLDMDGLLTIRRGYAWDGASGPTWQTDNTKTPSLVHDAFYQLMRMGELERWYRSRVDDWLDKMLKDRGMWRARRWWWMKGVSWFGNPSTDPANRKVVYEVA